MTDPEPKETQGFGSEPTSGSVEAALAGELVYPNRQLVAALVQRVKAAEAEAEAATHLYGAAHVRADAAEADRDVYVHLQAQAREALRDVADRMDDFAFDELNTHLSDGVFSDETGTEYQSRLSVAEAERDDLVRWKSEALVVMEGLQDLGKVLGVSWGERITGPVAVEAAVALRARAEGAEELAALQNGRAGVAEAERDTLREVNQRMATNIGNHSIRLQEDLDPLFKALGKINAILEPDWTPDMAVAGFEWEINAERVRAIRNVLKGGEGS